MLRRLRRYRVVGESMVPTLLPGQSVLVDPRAFRKRLPGVGELVWLRDPRQLDRMLLKRVLSVEEARVFVLGDNPSSSTDSRGFGAVPMELILGRVVCTFTGSN